MFLAVGIPVGAARAAPPEVIGCSVSYDPVPRLQPLGAGPMKLSAVYCSQWRQSGYPQSPLSLSPDKESFFSFDQVNGLSIGSLAPGAAVLQFKGRVSAGSAVFGGVPFAWSEDSQHVLGVKRDTAPGGWAISSLKPFAFSSHGGEHRLPDLQSEAGPLDGIHWAGENGLAVAEFGTKGE